MRRAEWTRGFWVKAAAFLLAMALVPVICFYAASLVLAVENDWWEASPDLRKSGPVRQAAWGELLRVHDYYAHFGLEAEEAAWFADPEETNLRFALYDENGSLLVDTITPDGIALDVSTSVEVWNVFPKEGEGSIRGGIAAELRARDGIYWALRLTEWLYRAFCSAGLILPMSGALLLFLLVFLARAAGRRPGREEAVAGWQERIPLDLYLAAVGICLFGSLLLLAERMDYRGMEELPLLLALCLLLVLAASALLLGTWMTLWTRGKLGKWWRNTVVFQLLRLTWRVLRALGRRLPLVWKTLLVLAGICLYELVCLSFRRDTDMLIFLWLLGKAVLIPAVLYGVLQLRKLQAGGAALAAGDLTARVDTRRMVWDLRRHGENLNDISLGMRRAVDRQLRSERLKTELITNVSHDIKTPLTSIISYVGLLHRDPGGPQAAEYLEVLDRQSRRLKKLTEDLVELSKASSGSMSFHPSRCSVNELMTQVLGEYSERLEQAGLEGVLTLPEEELAAWVDGSLIWRVLDNVFSNVCKYALPGTRFYMDAGREAAEIRLCFKNISRERLNISPQELMERFVRGDPARGGEGSGLGLNIAKSLAELQGGSFQISVDGDLFRVDITLPAAE